MTQFRTGQRVRHRKGGLYTVLCQANQSETGELLTIYVGEDGQVWARPSEMFNDGRFAPAVTQVEHRAVRTPPRPPAPQPGPGPQERPHDDPAWRPRIDLGWVAFAILLVCSLVMFVAGTKQPENARAKPGTGCAVETGK